MNKRDYLNSLREYLSYELPERLVKKNIDFYSGYFDEQQKAGKSAAEICGELGDPQLIAKSCIEAERSGADGIPNSGDDIDFSEEIERELNGRASDKSDTNRKENSGSGKTGTGFLSKAGCLFPLLAGLLLLVLLIVFLFTGLGSFVLYIALYLGVIIVLGNFFRKG